MSQPTLESLAQQAAAGDPTASDAFLTRLQTMLRSLDGGLLDKVARCALALKDQGAGQARPPEPPGATPAAPTESTAPPSGVVRLTPELLEWARQQFNEEEAVAALRDLRANGGISSEELLAVLDGKAESP